MKLDYEITDIGADFLRIRIIEIEARRHQHLIVERAKSRRRDRFLDDEIKDCERFFKSAWGQLLSGGCGEYIIEKNYEAAREMMKERRIKRSEDSLQ